MQATMNPTLWKKDDLTKIADFMGSSGEGLVQSIGITPPLRVLDLGCGDSTTALPIADAGAEVGGIDIARTWLLPAINERRRPVAVGCNSKREMPAVSTAWATIPST